MDNGRTNSDSGTAWGATGVLSFFDRGRQSLAARFLVGSSSDSMTVGIAIAHANLARIAGLRPTSRFGLNSGQLSLQQFQQLGDVRRDPPRLVFGEQFGC